MAVAPPSPSSARLWVAPRSWSVDRPRAFGAESLGLLGRAWCGRQESGPLGGHTGKGKGHWVQREGTVQEEDTLVKGRVLFSQDNEKPLLWAEWRGKVRFSAGAVRGRPGNF